MIRHARHFREVHDAAGGDDDLVVRHGLRRLILALIMDPTTVEVNVDDLLAAAIHGPQHLTQRDRRRFGMNGGACHLSQEGIKHQVIFSVEKNDFALSGREVPAERPGTLDAAEAPSDDDHSGWIHGMGGHFSAALPKVAPAGQQRHLQRLF